MISIFFIFFIFYELALSLILLYPLHSTPYSTAATADRPSTNGRALSGGEIQENH